jgi:hypothetical protein
MRNIGAPYPARRWNAIQIAERLDVGMMIASSVHRSNPSSMSESRRHFRLFLPQSACGSDSYIVAVRASVVRYLQLSLRRISDRSANFDARRSHEAL